MCGHSEYGLVAPNLILYIPTSAYMRPLGMPGDISTRRVARRATWPYSGWRNSASSGELRYYIYGATGRRHLGRLFDIWRDISRPVAIFARRRNPGAGKSQCRYMLTSNGARVRAREARNPPEIPICGALALLGAPITGVRRCARSSRKVGNPDSRLPYAAVPRMQ